MSLLINVPIHKWIRIHKWISAEITNFTIATFLGKIVEHLRSYSDDVIALQVLSGLCF